MNKKTYEYLIEKNIEEVEKFIPNSIERNHIIEILKQSIKLNYPNISKVGDTIK